MFGAPLTKGKLVVAFLSLACLLLYILEEHFLIVGEPCMGQYDVLRNGSPSNCFRLNLPPWNRSNRMVRDLGSYLRPWQIAVKVYCGLESPGMKRFRVCSV